MIYYKIIQKLLDVTSVMKLVLASMINVWSVKQITQFVCFNNGQLRNETKW